MLASTSRLSKWTEFAILQQGWLLDPQRSSHHSLGQPASQPASQRCPPRSIDGKQSHHHHHAFIHMSINPTPPSPLYRRYLATQKRALKAEQQKTQAESATWKRSRDALKKRQQHEQMVQRRRRQSGGVAAAAAAAAAGGGKTKTKVKKAQALKQKQTKKAELSAAREEVSAARQALNDRVRRLNGAIRTLNIAEKALADREQRVRGAAAVLQALALQPAAVVLPPPPPPIPRRRDSGSDDIGSPTTSSDAELSQVDLLATVRGLASTRHSFVTDVSTVVEDVLRVRGAEEAVSTNAGEDQVGARGSGGASGRGVSKSRTRTGTSDDGNGDGSSRNKTQNDLAYFQRRVEEFEGRTGVVAALYDEHCSWLTDAQRLLGKE